MHMIRKKTTLLIYGILEMALQKKQHHLNWIILLPLPAIIKFLLR